MCRFALYLGTPVTVGALVTEPSNSIIHQSFDSHERREPLNGDGFGIAWYVDGHREPVQFRDITPAWNNANLFNLARHTVTSCLLAHVRAATPGLSVEQMNCHPFVRDRFAFMHNGAVGGFKRIKRRLQQALSDDAFDHLQGSTDSEHIFALFTDRYRDLRKSLSHFAAMQKGLTDAIAQVEEIKQGAGIDEESTLNLAVSDGWRAVVSRYASTSPKQAPSLYVHAGRRYLCEGGVCRMVAPGTDGGGAVIVASEPLSKDPGWTPVEPNHMVLVNEHLHVEVKPLA